MRAFRHWNHLMHWAPTNPNSYLLVVDTTNLTEPYNPSVVACNQLSQVIGSKQLAHPMTVLQCVHEQWKNLQVYTRRSKPDEVVRIKGKAPGEETGTVARDDLWMAFSIGFQWCSRFVFLLPSDEKRYELVQYMAQIRIMVHDAIHHCLKDASLADDMPPGDRPTALPIATDVTPSLPPIATLDALVAVGGVINATLSVCNLARNLLRKLIMAYAAKGYQPPLGFTIQPRRVVRQFMSHTDQRYWKQQVTERLHSGRTLEQITKEFGVTISTLRISNAPPFRGGQWPGLKVHAKARREDVPLKEELDDLEETIDILDHLSGILLRVHAENHPILKHKASEKLPLLILRRMSTLVRLMLTMLPKFDEQVVYECTRYPITTFNKQCYEKKYTLKKQIPLPILTVYSELTEECMFLRKMQQAGRRQLIHALSLVPKMEWECSRKTSGEDAPDTSTPMPVARVSQRTAVQWKATFKSIWPDDFYTLNEKRQTTGTPRDIYQAFIHYHPHFVVQEKANGATPVDK